MFRYAVDRVPVMLILSFTLLDFILYFKLDELWFLLLFWLLMILPKGKISAWNHHHQHTPTFRSTALNRFLEFFYALHTGVTTHLWTLHHVLGHHLNFLDQNKDESRWKRASGETMGMLEYTAKVALTAYPRGFAVASRYPKLKKTFVFYALLTLLLVSLLVWYRPMQGLFLFVLPMITSLLLTSGATYKHHSDLSTDNEFEASRNNLNAFYNLTTGNLGYHTAHHYKQGVHWSRLPALHEKIKDKIPEHLIKYKYL